MQKRENARKLHRLFAFTPTAGQPAEPTAEVEFSSFLQGKRSNKRIHAWFSFSSCQYLLRSQNHSDVCCFSKRQKPEIFKDRIQLKRLSTIEKSIYYHGAIGYSIFAWKVVICGLLPSLFSFPKPRTLASVRPIVRTLPFPFPPFSIPAT